MSRRIQFPVSIALSCGIALSCVAALGCSKEENAGGTSASSNPPVMLAAEPGIHSTLLVPGAAPAEADGFGSDEYATLPLAVHPTDGRVLVGFNDAAEPSTAVLASSDGLLIRIENADIAGVAFTNDGVAALLFDPNPENDARVWAAVQRFAADGSELFRTELFHSANLEDEGTKGAPGTSRFGYIAASDELVAYFGHTQRYDDGVRHQGGYLALVNGSGEQELLSGWFGSHNLDQRLLIADSAALLLGLGDAYPEGIFYGTTDQGERANPVVLQPLASAGNGTTNGQLGGMVNQGDEVLLPFITNRSVPQDLDAGTWPDIDEAISDQIRDAAGNGTDLGLLRLAKSALPEDDTNLEVTWLDPQLGSGARLERLKSAPFGSDGLILLAWAEATGGGSFNDSGERTFYTMIVDANGGVAREKTVLDPEYAFSGGDDIVGNGGSVFWATAGSDGVQVVSFNPG